MQMQGEPVTLSNIESNIKRNFNIREGEPESTITKILLFPFRLIGLVLTALGRLIEPLAHVVRVMIGVIIIMMGIGLVFSIVVTGGVLLGIFASGGYPTPWMGEMDIPFEVFTRAFPGWLALAGIAAALVPSVFLILLGASVITRKLVFPASVGWSMFAIFLVSAAILAVGIPRIVYAFHEDGEYDVENVYKINGNTAVLKVNESGSDYDGVRLTLRGYSGSDFKLVQSFEAQGSSRSRAIENAKMVTYNVAFQDSVLTFDQDLEFKEDAVFRGQHVNMILYIPYDFPFVMDEGMSRLISQYVDGQYLDGFTWKMTRNGLECINCNASSDESLSDLRDFDQIEISGKFDLRILQGNAFNVELNGREEAKAQYDVRRSGETLIIDFERNRNIDFDWDNWDLKALPVDAVEIVITVPSLERIEAMGVGSLQLDEYSGQSLVVEARGPVNIRGDINVENLTIRLTGNSEAQLSGNVGNMNASAEFASRLRAYDLEVRDAIVEVSGASSAKVNVMGTLEIEEGTASDIDYRGNPNVVRRD